MLKRFAVLLCIAMLAAIGVSAQGLDTRATKDDWEEINFEYNSSVLVDGFPSLLRLAELLQKNPGYKVKLEGHTDIIGNAPYNDKLGMARATMVRDFLVKYNARPSQIEVTTRGKADPKYPGQRPYSKTDEARWMNRRVVVTVMDDQGRTVSAACVGEAIRSMEPAKPQGGGMTDCCSEVLKRLDRLDDIAKLLRDLADQNAQLRRDMDAMKQAQQVADSRANQPVQRPPTTQEVAQAVTQELNKSKEPKFQMLGVNVGMDDHGDVSGTGKGRFFGTFGEHYAFQAQGEFLYFKGQKEGQIDLGLVDRIGRFQAGLFSSFKHVSLSGNQSGATLGQASATFDYLFKWGKVGVFGTYAFLDNALINSQAATLPNGIVSPDLLEQRYLKVINQAGVSASAGLWGNNYVEGNLGYLKSTAYGDRIGGTLRFIFPLNNKIAFTIEGDMNPTILGPGNDGRAVVGVMFGNMTRPKDYLEVSHPVPVDVPRVRYEVINRLVRIGHTPPVADAGPDQIGVASGPIALNASASYSPDGLPITFRWIQEGGPSITLSNPTSAITTFAAAAGQSYIFRVVVTDSLGGQGQARVRVTTVAADKPSVLFFIANPTQIQSGQSSTLSWRVTNATTVTISGIGAVQAQGSAPVSPTTTTTYTLTATSPTGTESATATVVVNGSSTKLIYCYASPSNINSGESATLNWQTTNATSVSINNGVGNVGLSGSVPVSPTNSTTYQITANGPNGASDSCSVAVTVSAGALPRIIRFAAVPQTIAAGGTSTLLWVVENATRVNISPVVGNVPLGGTQDVTPSATTTYVLTATNAAGNVTAQATVTVGGAGPKITSFTATPNPSATAGAAVVLACTATNTTSVTLAGQVVNGNTASVTVNPQTTTPYTCIATGANGQTDQQTLTVVVGSSGGGSGPPVIVIKGGNVINTNFRFLSIDASGSSSPSGNNPLTYLWTSINDRATILNATSPVANVQLGPTSNQTNQGQYVFQLTVTDSKGNSASTIITVNFTL